MKSHAKQKNYFWRGHPRRFIIGGLLLFALLLGVYWGYNAYLDHADEARFAAVKTDVSQVRDRLQQQLGGNWDLSPVCGRAHEAFGDGAAYCSVSTNATFGISDGLQAVDHIKEFEMAMNGGSGFKVGGNRVISPDNFPTGALVGYGGRDYIDQKTGMICGTFYEIKAANKNQLALRFSCNDSVRNTYFPRFDTQN